MRMVDVDEELEFGNEQKVITEEQKVVQYLKSIQNGDVRNPTEKKSAAFVNINQESNVNYYDIENIPTGYRLYPEGTKIVARPMKVLEIKKLTSLTENNADSIINDVLRKCVRGIDIGELFIGDKLYLLFWLRANSFRDNKYVVEYRCNCCDKDSSYHFEIGNVNVDKIKNTYDPSYILDLSNGDGITVRYLKIKDEVSMRSFRDRYYEIITEDGEDIDDEVLSLSFMVDTINGKQIDPLTKYNYIVDLDPQDYSTLVGYVENNSMGIKSYLNVKCSLCGGESQTGLSFLPNFFLPRTKS